MIFEVYRGKQRLAWTGSADCVPPVSTQKSMIAAGLKLKMDNRAYRPAPKTRRESKSDV